MHKKAPTFRFMSEKEAKELAVAGDILYPYKAKIVCKDGNKQVYVESLCGSYKYRFEWRWISRNFQKALAHPRRYSLAEKQEILEAMINKYVGDFDD